jgi:hypothetical protein
MALAWLCHAVQAAEIRVSPWKDRNYYAWIVFLSEGPIEWREIPAKAEGEDPKSVGRAYRVVQLVSEIYDTVLIEEISLGDEGCCKKIGRVSKMDLDSFAKAFGFGGEISGFKFIKWESETSFRFRFHEREFLASGLGKPSLTVSENKSPR